MSGAEIASVITATVGLLGALGVGAKFVWNKIEKRFEHIENELEKCRSRDARGTHRRSVQRTVIELLWQEVERLSPAPSGLLLRVKRLLDELKQGDDDDAREERNSQ